MIEKKIPTVPVNLMERLKSISTARKIPLEELTNEYIKIIEDLEKQGTKGDTKIIARNVMMGKYRERKPYKRKRKYRIGNLLGFKIGDLGMQDDAQRMRDWTEFVINRDGLETAVKQGLAKETEESIETLDTRAKIFGRPNKQYGQPLSPTLKLRRRDLIFLAKEAIGETYEYARLQTKDNTFAIAWSQLPDHRLVAFPASVQSHDTSGYLLSSSKAEGTKTIFREVKETFDAFKEFEKWAKTIVTPINELPKYHEATKDAWDRWVVVKGVVASISYESETYRGIPCMLIDSKEGFEAEESIMFYAPTHLKMNFGVYSEIYVIGKTRAIMDTDEDTKRKYTVDVVLDAWGFMPIPGKTTEPKSGLLESPDEEEEIKAFIPAE